MSDSAVITLLTGLPGNGKTLSLVERLDKLAKQGEVIYVHGVNGLKVPHIPLDDPERWYDVPSGSVVVIDEAQKVFPVRGGTQAPPAKVAAFQTLRHRGLKAYLVTQHPKLIDSAVRQLIGAHFHYERMMGMAMSRQFEWPQCVIDPRAKSARRSASTSTYTFPRRIYDLYRSAEVHNVKRRIPKVVKVAACIMAFAVAAMVGGAYWFKRHALASQTHVADASASASDGSAKTSSSSTALLPSNPHQGERHVMTREEYIETRTPRFAGFPGSAPIYDELAKPTVMPKPVACIASKKSCKCYTQQATLIPGTPEGMCRDIAENGYFDDTERPVQVNGPTLAPGATNDVAPNQVALNAGSDGGDLRPGRRGELFNVSQSAPTNPGMREYGPR